MFSAKSLDFLFENRLNDRKSWFDEHKEDFTRYLLKPLQELVIALTPTMLTIDPEFVTEPRTDRTICRIRRDTRYSHDKSLYRDNMWIIFKKGRMHATEVPGFYVDISGSGVEYGCGFYHASTAYMQLMREMILSNDPLFLKAKKAYEKQKVFTMEGVSYRRSPFADQPEDLRIWLDRRNISFGALTKDFDLIFSDRLAEALTKDLVLLKPIYEFLSAVSEKEAAQEAENARLQFEEFR